MKEERNELCVASVSLGHIATRSKRGIPFSSRIVPREFVQLQKDHRQPFTTPHIYIATRPTRSWGDSKSRLGARHRHH